MFMVCVGVCFSSHGLLWTVFYCSAELVLPPVSGVLQLQKPGWLAQSGFIYFTHLSRFFAFLLKGKHIECVLYHVYFWKAQWVFYIPPCSGESMWSGIWFAQWTKKSRCLLKPRAWIGVCLSFLQTLPIAHFMASLCVYICDALEKARALLSPKLVLTSDQIKTEGCWRDAFSYLTPLNHRSRDLNTTFICVWSLSGWVSHVLQAE